jgi:hypothetical protein
MAVETLGRDLLRAGDFPFVADKSLLGKGDEEEDEDEDEDEDEERAREDEDFGVAGEDVAEAERDSLNSSRSRFNSFSARSSAQTSSLSSTDLAALSNSFFDKARDFPSLFFPPNKSLKSTWEKKSVVNSPCWMTILSNILFC